jgi:lysophospholipase L1-like esterase
MALFDKLKQILTPYANKINLHTEEIEEIQSDVSEVKADLAYKVNHVVIYCDNVEDGYYSNNNGQKYPNSSTSDYKRSVNLIPADEDCLYIANRITLCCCYDKDGTFISSITLYTKTDTFIRHTTPVGTAYVGLSATNATGFQLIKMTAEDVRSIEYPYESDSYVHIESYWCNGEGNLRSTQNFDLLIIPVKEGERWYVSNSATYNLMCFDATGTLLTATYESRSPIGKIVTVPAGAKTMCVNLYRARTKGVNSEMSDYVARVDRKKILAIGDSLTWLDGRQNYGGMAYFSGWQRQLKLAGYDVINAGWSGYPYATGLDIVNNVDYSIYKEIVTNTYDVSGYDIIILFGGTNDVLYNGALGGRPTDYSNRTFDASTFNGALGAIISYIRTNNTTALILLASFPKSEAVERSYSNAKSRVDEIKYNADFWSCKYVDIWEDLNIQPTYDEFDQYFYDSTHANFSGMEKIGKLMLNAVKSYM